MGFVVIPLSEISKCALGSPAIMLIVAYIQKRIFEAKNVVISKGKEANLLI